MKKLFLYFIIIFTIISCVTIKTKQNIAYDYYNLANEYYSLKNYDKAITFYLKAISYDKKINDAKINLIISYQKKKQYDKAEKLIVKEYKSTINNFDKSLLLLLANNYFDQAKYKQSIKTYKLYIDHYPTDIYGYFNLGLAYSKVDDEENSVKQFLKIYSLNKQFAPAIYNLALYYNNKKKYKESLKYYKVLQNLSDAKSDPDIYYNLGKLRYNFEEYEEAKSAFESAIKIDNENPDYYIALAKLFAKGYNDKDKTLENIGNALKNGYKDYNNFGKFSEFKLLLEEYKDEFDELIKKYTNK